MNAMTEVQEPLLFTDNAANKVKELIEEEAMPILNYVYLSVEAGVPAFSMVLLLTRKPTRTIPC